MFDVSNLELVSSCRCLWSVGFDCREVGLTIFEEYWVIDQFNIRFEIGPNKFSIISHVKNAPKSVKVGFFSVKETLHAKKDKIWYFIMLFTGWMKFYNISLDICRVVHYLCKRSN